MRVAFDFSALRKTKWYEYAVRFFFGGIITVLAGLVAKAYGPTVGGLFLAFPAIFPATATLVEKHERERKRKAGIRQTGRGRQAAALDAYGAALGAAGLLCFGLVAWQLLPEHNAVLVLIAGTIAWITISILLWRIRKSPWWP
jgi:Protein of unknown function (DUF3147)